MSDSTVVPDPDTERDRTIRDSADGGRSNDSIDRVDDPGHGAGDGVVLAVLLVAGEYTARTASMTFTLDPSRGRVLSGKAIVVLALALVASALSYLAAASVAAVAPLVSGRPIAWTADPAGVGIVVGSVVFSAMAGYALALAFRNAVAPILLLLVWPTVALLIGALSPTLKEPLGYLDVDPVFGLMDGASNAVVKLLVSALVWVALPVVVGAWRTLNRDVE